MAAVVIVISWDVLWIFSLLIAVTVIFLCVTAFATKHMQLQIADSGNPFGKILVSVARLY